MTRLIYDFGMNNGDDVEYYLKKGARVVAVEANPAMCRLAEDRFRAELVEGQLTILNVVLTGERSTDAVAFYVHKSEHVHSQVTKPDPAVLHEFDVIQVEQARASDIVRDHGEAQYIKIDLEGVDQIVLSDLFEAEIFPDLISAEVHTVEVFARLISAGYNAFNLVDGLTVGDVYGHALIATPSGAMRHSFLPHSAGPFGEDITSPWRDSDAFFSVLAAEGLGWKDIHASRTIEPERAATYSPSHLLSPRQHLWDFLPSCKRAIAKRRRALQR